MALDFASLTLGPSMVAFGEDVQFTPLISNPGAPPQTLIGIFHAEHVVVDHDLEVAEHHSTAPVLGIDPTEWPEIESGDQVEIRGINYLVFGSPQSDGIAGTKLILKKL